MPSTPVSLDPQTQALLSRLFDLHAEAEESGHTLVANGLMAIIAALHLTRTQQQIIGLLLHDVMELARCVESQVPLVLVQKSDRRRLRA